MNSLNRDGEKKVICEFCKQKINLENFGGIYPEKRYVAWFCDKLPCLIEFEERRKSLAMPINQLPKST